MPSLPTFYSIKDRLKFSTNMKSTEIFTSVSYLICYFQLKNSFFTWQFVLHTFGKDAFFWWNVKFIYLLLCFYPYVRWFTFFQTFSFLVLKCTCCQTLFVSSFNQNLIIQKLSLSVLNFKILYYFNIWVILEWQGSNIVALFSKYKVSINYETHFKLS